MSQNGKKVSTDFDLAIREKSMKEENDNWTYIVQILFFCSVQLRPCCLRGLRISFFCSVRETNYFTALLSTGMTFVALSDHY